jgi:RNA polymerase sigma-70 factor (ECF subfamily)
MGAHPKIADFSGRGPLATWLRAAAVRTALNHRQTTHREISVGDEEWSRMPGSGSDPELAILRTRFRKEFGEAFEQALQTLTQQDRNLLRLHLLDGLSIDKLAVMFQTHRSTVARWIQKSRELLVVETKKGLAEKLKVSNAELEELMGLVRSQLDVSINRYLRVTKTP